MKSLHAFSSLLLTENRNKLPGSEMEYFSLRSPVKMLPKLCNSPRKPDERLPQEQLAEAQPSPCVCTAFATTRIVINGPNFALLSASTPLTGTGEETNLRAVFDPWRTMRICLKPFFHIKTLFSKMI